MISRTAKWSLVLTAGLCLAAAGCSDFRGSGGSSGSGGTASTTDTKASAQPAGRPGAMARASLIPQSRPPVADLPVPVGFVIAESISRSYESAGSRYVDHTYQGRADKLDVERFVREHLATKSWTLRTSQMIRGEIRLKYEKGSELLDVNISGTDRPILGQSTTLNYNLQTVGRGDSRR